jgi:hypothetical protein
MNLCSLNYGSLYVVQVRPDGYVAAIDDAAPTPS